MTTTSAARTLAGVTGLGVGHARPDAGRGCRLNGRGPGPGRRADHTAP